MSVRPEVEALGALEAAEALGAPPVALAAALATTGCGYNAYIGAIMPCGMIVSYGDGTMEHAYIVTTKAMSTLDSAGDRLVKLTPSSMTNPMMAVQKAINGVAGRMMYGNVYGYQPGVHGKKMRPMKELKRMGGTRFSTDSGKAHAAFAPVRAALDDAYTAGGYTMTAFRITKTGYY